MNNIRTREWIQTEDDTVMTIADWEECVRDGLFIDYDGYGYFCDPAMKTELLVSLVYPSMIDTPAYEQRKVNWTHINWFNR
jgi:hypothetical protein